MKIYLDQNSWRYLSEDIPVDDLKRKIVANNFQVYLGTGHIYESGKLSLKDDYDDIALLKQISSYLWDMADLLTFVKMPDQLIKDDLIYARSGGRSLPFLDRLDTAAAKQALFQLSQGNTDTAKNFIKNREENIRQSSTEFTNKLKQLNPKINRKTKFENWRDNWSVRRQCLNKSEYSNKSKNLSDSLLFSNPEKYPFINTWINAQIYIAYAVLVANAKPKNPTPDFRHLICSNTAGNFVTNDHPLFNKVHKVCPYINAYKWSEFYNILKAKRAKPTQFSNHLDLPIESENDKKE